jgi:hypothetical protein
MTFYGSFKDKQPREGAHQVVQYGRPMQITIWPPQKGTGERSETFGIQTVYYMSFDREFGGGL